MVETLRIELLTRSLANGITSTGVPYTLQAGTVDETETIPGAGDRYLYKVMINTIALRNKAI